MTQQQIAKTMRRQFMVWEDNPDAIEAIEDTCHALANGLNLKAPSVERTKFLRACGLVL